MPGNNDEMRCYQNPGAILRVIEIMGLYPLLLLGASIYHGTLTKTFWLPITIFVFLFLFWYASRWGNFIVVRRDKQVLEASNYFFRTKSILIKSIVSIGTRSAFAGSAIEMEITYLKPGGKKKVLGFGTKNLLNRADLQKILSALVEINPKLHIPAELRG
jgi:hypothetical protein